MANEEVRVLVTGSRRYNDPGHVAAVLSSLLKAANGRMPPFDRTPLGNRARFVLLQGGGRGANRLARAWAATRPEVHVVAERSNNDPRQLIDTYRPDVVVALAGGHSTIAMVAKARRAGARVVWAARRP